MERLGYGTEYHDDDDSGRAHRQYQEKHEEAYEPEFDLDPDAEYWEEDHRAGTQDAVDHQADFALNAESKAERMAAHFKAHFKWRNEARAAAKEEKWDPPDTREFRAPVFVRMADLQQRQDDVPR